MWKSSSRFLRSGSAAALALYAASALVFGLAVSAPAAAQDYTSGALSGNVTDAAGAPVADASVVLMSEDQGFTRSTTTTRSDEHTSELQSLMRISYAVFCLKKKNKKNTNPQNESIF